MKTARRLLAVTLLFAIPLAWAGPKWQSLDSVQQSVADHLRKTLDMPGQIAGIQVDHLDPRLRLSACSEPLEPFLLRKPTQGGRVTVGVRCTAPKPWKLYVPARISRYLEVVVAAHPIARGVALSAEDLRLQRIEAGALRNAYYQRRDRVVGLRTRQALRAGEVISPRDVSAPLMVQRGQVLIIEAASDTVAISMRARALEDGSQGDLIRVRNLSSDRVIEARVIARDRVRTAF